MRFFKWAATLGTVMTIVGVLALGSGAFAAAPTCSDGLDNDGNGRIDYPQDLGCSSAADTTEASPVSCPSNVNGTSGNDTFIGTDGANRYSGLGGDDFMFGQGGNDCLFGGNGGDVAFGGDGNDLLDGGAGGDRVEGEAGADVIYGGAGGETITGGDGADQINPEDGTDSVNAGAAGDLVVARDGIKDNVDCGSGTDVAITDPIDTVTNCETVQNAANRAPTGIALSNASVAENQSVGTTVGTLSATDPDLGDAHTFSLVSGVGDTDNASFQTDGSTLKTNAVFDFEAKSSYSIRVRATDTGNLSFEKEFTITITNVAENGAPTDITLSPSSVSENEPAATEIGTLAAVDPDVGDSATFALVGGVGDTDNASFQITGNKLKTNAVFDFEAKSSYSIRVRATDAANASFDKVLTVTITDVAENQAPTDISLSNATVDENQAVATTVGTLSATDPNAGDTHTFALVAGTGDTDNASFQTMGSTLKTNAVFDFEAKSSYSIRVRATDQGNLDLEKQLTITINDVAENLAPTDISLSNATVDENQAVATTVGTLSATDPNAGDTHTFALVAGTGDTDNASFQTMGSTLKTNAVFDFEAKSSYSIRVRATDQGNLYREAVHDHDQQPDGEQPADRHHVVAFERQ